MSIFLIQSDQNTDSAQIPCHYISLPQCLIFVGPQSVVSRFLEYSIIYHRDFNVCVTVVTCNVLMLDLLQQLGLQTAPTAMP